MNTGFLNLNFDFLKEHFNLPKDSLLKYIDANNKTGEIIVSFYTNEKNIKYIV